MLFKFWVEPRRDEKYDSPVLLTLHGNALDGSHFDDWRYEWTSFTPRAPEDAVFAQPELCAGVVAEPFTFSTPHTLRLLSLLPPTIAAGAVQTLPSILDLSCSYRPVHRTPGMAWQSSHQSRDQEQIALVQLRSPARACTTPSTRAGNNPVL